MFTGARKKDKGGGDKDKRDPPKDKGKDSRDKTPENKTPKKRKRKPSMVASNSDMDIGGCLPCSPFKSPRKSSHAKSAIEERSLSTTDSGINTASVSETSSSRPADSSEHAEPLAGPSTLATTKTEFKSSPPSSGLNTSSTSASSINFSDKRLSLSSHEASKSSSSSRNTSTRSKSGEHPNLLKYDKASSSPSKVPSPISGVELFRRRSQRKKTDTGSKISSMMLHMQLGEQKSGDHFLRSLRPRIEGPEIPFCIPPRPKPGKEPLPPLNTEDDIQNFKTQVTSPLDMQKFKKQLTSPESVDPQEGTSKGPSQKTPKKTSKYIQISKQSSDESNDTGAVAPAADPDPHNKEKSKKSKYKNGFTRDKTSKLVNFFRRKSVDNKSKDGGSNLSTEHKDDSPSDDENNSKTKKRRKKLTRQQCVDRKESSSSSEDIADK